MTWGLALCTTGLWPLSRTAGHGSAGSLGPSGLCGRGRALLRASEGTGTPCPWLLVSASTVVTGENEFHPRQTTEPHCLVCRLPRRGPGGGGEATRPAGSPRTLGDAVLPTDDPLLTPRLGRLSLSVSRPTPPPALSRAGWGWCPSAPGHCPGRSWLFGLESRPTPGQEPPLAASRPSPLPPAPPHPPVPQTPTTAKVQTPGPARAHESEGRPADAV